MLLFSEKLIAYKNQSLELWTNIKNISSYKGIVPFWPFPFKVRNLSKCKKKLWMLYSLKSREQSISYLYYHSAIILQVIELLVYSSTRQYAIKLIIILFSASRERRSHHACFFIESHKQISTLMKYSLLVVPNIFFVESTIHFLRSSMHLKVGCVKIDIL